MTFPERFVVALLEDARRIAEQHHVRFELHTHSRARLEEKSVHWRSRCGGEGRLTPALIVNATGAWGDFTLRELPTPSKRLFGGTKGSHILTYNERLVEALGSDAIYGEADDGRLVFILPLAGAVYIGTTDEPFEQSPEKAVATRREVEYLVGMVNEIFPEVHLTTDDVEMHCCGVRPLPHVDASSPSSITRRHAVVENDAGAIPILTLVGGKLTTCRSLGEEAADRILEKLHRSRRCSSRERVIPGGEDYPAAGAGLLQEQERIAARFRLSLRQVQAAWKLCGRLCVDRFAHLRSAENVADTDLPKDFVRAIIDAEWVETLDDLVERRLLLIYHRRLTRETLVDLAKLLVEFDKVESSRLDAVVDRTCSRLLEQYGKRVESAAARA
jgi:glycerol-3-phosphate dehydrogenase